MCPVHWIRALLAVLWEDFVDWILLKEKRDE